MKSKLLLVFLCLSIPLITGLAQETRTVDYEDLFWRRALHTDERYLVFATVDDLDCREPGCERQLVVVDRQDEQVQYTLDYTAYLEFAVSTSGDRFAMVRMDGEPGTAPDDVTVTIEFRSLEDGEILTEWELPAPDISNENLDPIVPYVGFTDDLSIFYRYSVVRGDVREISVWDSDIDNLLFEESCDTEGLVMNYDASELLSPDGNYLLQGCIDETFSSDIAGYMSVIDLSSGNAVQKIPRYVQNASIRWDDNSSYILVRGNDIIRVYNFKQEVFRLSVEGYVDLDNAFSSDSRYVYLVSPLKTRIHVFDLENNDSQVIEARKFDADTVEFANPSPYDNSIFIALSSSDDETMRLILMDVESSTIIQETIIADLYESGISTLVTGDIFHGNGRYLSICQSGSNGVSEPSIYLWDTETNTTITISNPPTPFVMYCAVDFSSDGRYVSFFRSYFEEDDTTSARIVTMELSSQEIVFETILNFDTYILTIMEWEGDNRLLYVDPLQQAINFVDLP